MFLFQTKPIRTLKSTGSVLIVSTIGICLFLFLVLNNITSTTVMLSASTVALKVHQTNNNENAKINHYGNFNLLSDYSTNDDTFLLEECTLGSIERNTFLINRVSYKYPIFIKNLSTLFVYNKTIHVNYCFIL